MLNALELRILEISYRNKLSHISSCLTAVNIIDEIYNVKKDQEPFILSCGHAFLALAVVLEKRYGTNAGLLIEKYGTHPTRNKDDRIWFTTGSLGCGITAACGFALADRNRQVYCLISDGECAEPEVFSALNFAREVELNNLHIYVNLNGYSAYKKIYTTSLCERLMKFWDKVNIVFTKSPLSDFDGIDGHYKTLNETEYNEIIRKNEGRL